MNITFVALIAVGLVVLVVIGGIVVAVAAVFAGRSTAHPTEFPCPDCGGKMLQGSPQCPHCGAKLG